jgi:hypothetical protein
VFPVRWPGLAGIGALKTPTASPAGRGFISSSSTSDFGGSAGAAGASSSLRFISLTPLITMNSTQATITKLMIALMNSP